MFANRGYAVLQVNYRGSGGYGRAFQDAGHLQWGQGIQNDILDATHWAVREGYADSDRICIYGGSFGGYSALMRSEEHTSELQSLMRISYAVFCLKKKNTTNRNKLHTQHKH